jgi:N-acetylmuramoyl-L-alanine amidase
MPGDVVFIPDKRLKEVPRPTEQLHKFRIKNTPKTLRIQLKYLDDVIANADYKVTVDDLEKTGKTDSKGWLVCTIAPNAKKARVSLGGEIEWEVMLGYLDPLDEMTGIQGRLAHLGFFQGEVDGNFSPETKQAVKVFQLSHNLEPTGEIDSQTKALLKALTGE